MAKSERRLRQIEDTRLSILNTARQIGLSEGWEAVTIRRITSAIDFSAPVIYSLFESKNAIFYQLLKEAEALLFEKLQASRLSNPSGPATIKALVRTYFQFGCDHFRYYQLISGLNSPLKGDLNDSPVINWLLQILRENLPSRTDTSDAKTDRKLWSLLSISHGLISLQARSPSWNNSDYGMILEDHLEDFLPVSHLCAIVASSVTK